MIRQSDATGAPYVENVMFPSGGLNALARFASNEGSMFLGNMSANYVAQPNLYMRLASRQRHRRIYLSRWPALGPAHFPPQTLSTLGETALFGITTTSGEGQLSTARMDNVSVGSEITVSMASVQLRRPHSAIAVAAGAPARWVTVSTVVRTVPPPPRW